MDSDDAGMAIRPVEGVPIEKIDGILQDMVGYNNKLSPYYMPRTSVEEVDGRQVLVIWCPAGINRPYSVPENVTAKSGSKHSCYRLLIQSKSPFPVLLYLHYKSIHYYFYLLRVKGSTNLFCVVC